MSSLSPAAALTVEWALGGIAIILTAGRYVMRWYVLNLWYWDDLLHGLALMFAIIDFGIYSGTYDSVLKTKADRVTALNQQVASTVMWLTSLWCVKFAFLLFYRRIFEVSPRFLKYWWALVVFTFLSYWVVIGGWLSQCNGYPVGSGDPNRCGSPRRAILSADWFIYSYCLNVASDLFTIFLPLPWVYKLQLSTLRKLGIAVVMCLGFAIIAFETARFVINSTDPYGLTQVWSDIEVNVAIIVSCLPSFIAVGKLRKTRRTRQTSEATLRDGSKTSSERRSPEHHVKNETQEEDRREFVDTV